MRKMRVALMMMGLVSMFSACQSGFIDCEIAVKNLRDEIVKIQVSGGGGFAMPANGKSYDDYSFYAEESMPMQTVKMFQKDSDGEFTDLINTVEFPVQSGGVYYLDTESAFAINLSSLSGNPLNESEDDEEQSSQTDKDCNDDPVSKKYQDMINEGTGCQPCANCAALACMLYLGVQGEQLEYQIEAVKIDEDYYGAATCPELY